MSLRSVNLNLIPILQALLRHRNVSRAAESLNLSQPTVSIALTRLREILADPLMIQVGRKMELTPRARQLIRPVEEACAAIQSVLNAADFDPGSANRTFSIAGADHIPSLIGPAIIESLDKQAPHVTVHFVDISREISLRHRLGEIDLMIVPRTVSELLSYPEIRITHLFYEQFVKVVGKSHPLSAKAGASDEDCSEYPHVIFSPALAVPEGLGDPFGMTVATAASPDYRPRVVAKFADFGPMPLMAALSNSVAIVPRRLALLMKPFLGLQEVGTPLPVIDICLAWSPLLESDPAHRWFRNLLLDSVGDGSPLAGASPSCETGK